MSDALKPGTLPNMKTQASLRLPQQWAALPMHIRVLHALAEAAGLEVGHLDAGCPAGAPGPMQKMRDWYWIGTDAAFRNSGLFRGSVNWCFRGWATTETAEGLRVNLMRFDPERGGAVVAVHDGFARMGKRSSARFAAMAEADAAYQRVRSRLLAPIPGYVLEKEPEDEWRGNLLVEVPELVIKRAKWENAFKEVRKEVAIHGPCVGLSATTAAALRVFTLMHLEVTRNGPDEKILRDFAAELARQLADTEERGGNHGRK